ncbi:hypothetical protein ACXPVS_10775 [Pseudomonas sp. Ma2-10]
MEDHLFTTGLVAGQDIDTDQRKKLQAWQEAGDRVLVDTLIASFSTAISRGSSRLELPMELVLPQQCMLRQWLGVYLKSLELSVFEAWAAQYSLDLHSFRLQGGTLFANAVIDGVTTAKVFTLQDASGWKAVADPIIEIVRIIDPANADPNVVAAPLSTSAPTFFLRTTLAFYGCPLPANRAQAQVLVDEWRQLRGFSPIDGCGHSRTALLLEIDEQAKDCISLASELDRALQAVWSVNGRLSLQRILQKRIKLASGSMLSNSMRLALGGLRSITEKMNEGQSSPGATYYFSNNERTLMEVVPSTLGRRVSARQLAAAGVDGDLRVLAVQAEKLGVDIDPDGRFSLAYVLGVYEWALPADEAGVQALILQLRQVPEPRMPYVHESAHSVRALVRHRRYLGLLNNRYRMRAELENLSRDKADDSAVSTVNLLIEADGNSPLDEITQVGIPPLLAVMALDEFKAIRTARRIAPDTHVLIGDSSYVGAWTLDNTWADLTEDVLRVPALAPKIHALAMIAFRTGGALRSNGELTLEQMLRFYSIQPPVTAKRARTQQERLSAIPLRPRVAEQYWNALGGVFALAPSQASPSRQQVLDAADRFMPGVAGALQYWGALADDAVVFALSASQRQQLVNAVEGYMAGRDEALFDYLAAPVLIGKTKDVVRDEADLLFSQILATPRARKLARVLLEAVTWQGQQGLDAAHELCRHSLVLAALILTLDPQAGLSRNRLAGLDLADDRYWGETYRNLSSAVEAHLEYYLDLDSLYTPLAAHLLLCGVAPEFQVRDIPDAMSYMSSQTWVHYKHCIAYLEGKYPGSSRRLKFNSIMTGVKLTSFKPEFWALNEFRAPVIDWAVANGVLGRHKEVFTQAELDTAKAALLAQNTRLQTAISSLWRGPVSRRAMALSDLRQVYSDHRDLEKKVLRRQSDAATDTQTGDQLGERVSLVDLHLSGQLTAGSTGWQSTLDSIDFPLMAQRFHLLGAMGTLYGGAFGTRLGELRLAFLESIQFEISKLLLRDRMRLEYGELTLFSLRNAGAAAGAHGRFGLVVLCTHPAFADCSYEFFPVRLMIIRRADLTSRRLSGATATRSSSTANPVQGASAADLLPLDWAAYDKGGKPIAGAKSAVSLERVGRLPLVADQASPAASNLSVPKTPVSPRILDLVTRIVDKSLLLDSAAMRLSASDALSLDDVKGGHDQWADYLESVAFRPQ